MVELQALELQAMPYILVSVGFVYRLWAIAPPMGYNGCRRLNNGLKCNCNVY